MLNIKTCLIIEDDIILRKTLLKFLSVYVQVSEVNTLEEARKLLDAKDFDVVILDKKLRDDNGLEVIPEIRKQKPEMAIIVTSGDLDFSLVYHAIESGADDYVLKGDSMIQDLLIRMPLAKKHRENSRCREKTVNSPTAILPSDCEEVTPSHFDAYLDQAEKEYISRVLELCNRESNLVARLLGLARSTLHKKMTQYDLQRRVYRSFSASSVSEFKSKI